MDVFNSCYAALEASDLSKCQPLGLELDAWFTIFGIGIAALGIYLWQRVWWVVSNLVGLPIRLAMLAWQWYRTPVDFDRLLLEIEPLLRDNGRIFSAFGPQSGDSAKDVRYDLSLWYVHRQKIAVNNAAIRQLIKSQLFAIPIKHRELFNRWLSHIDAFESHVGDETIDYRDHQFPKDILKLFHEINR